MRFEFGKTEAGKLSNLFYLFLLVWKFSSILFYWQTIIHTPVVLLYYNGGEWGIRLGIISVIILLLVYRQKDRSIGHVALKAWSLLLIWFEAIKIILTYSSWIDGVIIIGLIILLIGVWHKRLDLLSEAPILTLLIIAAIQWLVVSLDGSLFTFGLLNSWLLSAVLLMIYRREKGR